jgi:NCS1 family nucleobase:cation symporter-1
MHAPEPQRSSPPTVEWIGLEQVPSEARHGTPARVGALWFAAQLVPTAFFLGALGSAEFIGLSFGPALLAIVVGTAVGALAPAALSVAGPRTGLPQLAQARAIFGQGSALVGVLAFGTSIAFIALGSIFGAEALGITLGLPFLPAVVLVFLAVALVSTLGYRFMHRVERVMAVVVGAGFLVLTVAVAARAGDITLTQTSHGGAALGSFGLMAAISCGFTFAWAHNAADYCRYLPSDVSARRLFTWVWLGIVSACVWLEGLGLAASTLLPDTAPMAAVHALVGGGPLGAAVLVALCLGVVANATVAQYSAGLQLLAAGVRLPRPVVTVLTGLVALALTLYLQHGDLAPRFTNVMLLASYWVGPFVGIVAVWWWQRPSTAGLAAFAASAIRALPARPHAVAALVAGFLACLPFSNTTLGNDLAARHAVLNALLGSVSRGVLHGADLAYPVGLLTGGGVYLWLEGVGALRAIRAARVPAISAGQPL